jgi:anti-sigma regulatory factor (Ser/Thr protein kinase)
VPDCGSTLEREVVAGTMPTLEVDLPASARAPALARHRLAEVLVGAAATWGCAEDRDTAVLLVSELVTNVVRHTGSAPRLTVTTAGGVLRCAVRDADPAHPVTRAPSFENESGRGMLLVAALASAWGVDDDSSGKLVWFELRA